MSLKFWLNKPIAFANVWRQRGLFRAVYESFRYVVLKSSTVVDDLKQRGRYQQWADSHYLNAEAEAEARAAILQWTNPPTFSVLVPVYNTQPRYLKLAIESVRAQLYPYWQLILADDYSSDPATQKMLRAYESIDERIQVLFLPQNGGISAATNAALEVATGDFIALLDHDDELATQALYENAKVIQEHPHVDVLYSDEDKITGWGEHFAPFFKPDWSPDYLHSCMYTCHLGVYRTSLVRQIGGFRPAYDGAQDWDLMLRLVEKTDQVYHIPKVLYHWRAIATSTASGAVAKPWAYTAAHNAIDDMAHRSVYPGHVEDLAHLGLFRVRRQLIDQPLVSIIIPSAGTLIAGEQRSHLEACLESIVARSTYKNIELVVVDGFDIPADILDRAKSFGIELVRCDEPFNFSRRINAGAAHSRGDILLLLNDDIEVQTPDWIESMLEFCQQSEIGAVGAKLLFPNGNFQHAGVVIVDGEPKHVRYNESGATLGYFGNGLINRNFLCVTGACLMLRREVFHQVGGLDDAFPLSYNDVDFCLKIHQAGYRNVYTPFAELIHYGSASRAPQALPEELEAFRARWRPYLNDLGGDPYYNPNFDPQKPDFTPSY